MSRLEYPFICETGLTVKKLKDIVMDLIEKDSNGEDYTVWISDRYTGSYCVKEVWPLNYSENGSDIIFEANYDE
jgi:hypothetical protein